MSRETIEWLTNNTMIGMIGDRETHAANNWMIMQDDGTYRPWWSKDGGFPHSYEGFIPREDVERVLFNWEPVESTVRNMVPCALGDEDGIDGNGNPFRIVVDTKRKGIVHPDTDVVFGYFGIDSYQVHSYKQWLITEVNNLIDGDGGIVSAGLLRQGGQAYVSMSLPEGVTVGGFDLRPMIVAGNSCDGTLSGIYCVSDFAALCDNSFNAIVQGAENVLKIKHSARSLTRLGERRQLLGIINEHTDQITAFLDMMMATDVTDGEFAQIVKAYVPPVDIKVEGGKVTNQRALTIAERKMGELAKLWRSDPRVAKWNGTLFGAYQAANTWNQHFRSNNENVVERSMTGILSGDYAKQDVEFWKIIKGIDTINLKGVGELLKVGGK